MAREIGRTCQASPKTTPKGSRNSVVLDAPAVVLAADVRGLSASLLAVDVRELLAPLLADDVPDILEKSDVARWRPPHKK